MTGRQKIYLPIDLHSVIKLTSYGGVAQLGEHLTGSQGVRGSSPLISILVNGYCVLYMIGKKWFG